MRCEMENKSNGRCFEAITRKFNYAINFRIFPFGTNAKQSQQVGKIRNPFLTIMIVFAFASGSGET